MATATKTKTTDVSDVISPSPEILAMCDEFLRRDRAWREIPRPSPGNPNAHARYAEIAREWHFGGQMVAQIQTTVRPLVKLRHLTVNLASPIVTRIRWEHGGYLWVYDFDGNRLITRKLS